ncbi:MAG TPA: ribonuclease III [Actinomycetota bacterium]|nr:ribonuclease III [Actinomycetota bacterium]
MQGLEILGVPPEGGDRFDVAVTHRSYAFEQPSPVEHNERLEFLGDAILGAVVTDLIFSSYPELPEGEMARLRASLVNTHALADMAREVGVGRHLRLGRGEEASGGREKASLLADTFEAIIGAVYLERGMDAVCRALVPLFERRIRDVLEIGERYDAKTALQEVVVRDRGATPDYRVTSTGPDHDKWFTASVFVAGVARGEGEGRSKKEAEQNAARAALGRMDGAVSAAVAGAGEGPPRERGRDAGSS